MEHKQKKLILLGGLRSLLPVIRAAHEQGYYVITCDYIPGNIAHEYSDEYHNISITDKEAVLNKARELQIDGIMSFPVDPGVVAAAYVQEQMGLPGVPYKSALILQNKDKFRQFLKEHGFAVPWFKGFDSVEAALADKENHPWPVLVKPTDSAGSKGITKVDRAEQLEPALRYAMSHSLSKRIVIEEFIEPGAPPSDSECFAVDGKLQFVSYSVQRLDGDALNPFVPFAYSWPSGMTAQQEADITAELQRLISLLGIKTSIFNVEARIGKDNKPYLMEVSPRGGGPRLAELVRYATGVDLVANAVRVAVGDKPAGLEQKPCTGHWAKLILHARKKGKFSELKIDPGMAGHVVETDLWVQKGDTVNASGNWGETIGILIARFDSADQLRQYFTHPWQWVQVILE